MCVGAGTLILISFSMSKSDVFFGICCCSNGLETYFIIITCHAV